jgi:uncharacterized protein YggE
MKAIASISTVLTLAFLPLAIAAQSTAGPPVQGITVRGAASDAGVVRVAAVNVYVRGIEGNQDEWISVMRAAGVENPVVVAGAVQGAPRATHTLRGTLGPATPANLMAIQAAVMTFAKTNAGAELIGVYFFGDNTECPAIEERARAGALADARRRAQAIAAVAHVSLGAPVVVDESGGCPRTGPAGGGYVVDPRTMTTRIPVVETVTFAIASARTH